VTLKYGGNTSCVELRSAKGTLVVIDAGSGLRLLGIDMLTKQPPPISGTILLTHTHWDHIQGIPFFQPLFDPRNHWDLYAPGGFESSTREILAGQMAHFYFPLAIDQFGATIHYHELIEGQFVLNDILVTTQYLNHPCLTLAYRFDVDGVSVVYFCDHEPYTMALAEGLLEENGQNERHYSFLKDADLVIFDSQYTLEEYCHKRGWGHSTMEYSTTLCRSCGVKRLAFSHHDPQHSDLSIDLQVEKMRARLQECDSTMEVFAAAEGLTVELQGTAEPFSSPPHQTQRSALVAPRRHGSGHIVFLLSSDSVGDLLFSSILDDAEISYRLFEESSLLLEAIQQTNPLLVIVTGNRQGMAIETLCDEIRQRHSSVPIIIVADQECGNAPLVTDSAIGWLHTPFSPIYAKSLVYSWLLR
jgi:phosphoribosyl 1,2-cyclic phosphodiesterase/CheY-like chemotaxis protein